MTIEPEDVLLQVTTTAPAACCPRGAVPSATVHSHYQRHLTDLPWGTRPVRLATQVADRFHVLQNLAEARDHVFSTHGKGLKAVREALSHTPVVQLDGQTVVPVPPSTPTPQAQTPAAQRRSRRLALYEQVWALSRQGWSHRAMAQQLGMGRMPVVRYLQTPTFPERKERSDTGKSILTPDKERLLTRWNAGCREALQRFRDLRRRGYTGSYPTGARYAQRLRQAQGLQPRERRLGQTLPRVVEALHRPLTTRRASRLVLKRPEHRTNADTQLLAHIESQHHDLAEAIGLAQDCGAIVRQRQANRFDEWLARTVAGGVEPLQRCARGLRADYEAVKAGLRLPWSNGPVEGHINRLKLLKRQMFGRAKLDLLSRRSLRAA